MEDKSIRKQIKIDEHRSKFMIDFWTDLEGDFCGFVVDFGTEYNMAYFKIHKKAQVFQRLFLCF